jgi:hypothetical protein
MVSLSEQMLYFSVCAAISSAFFLVYVVVTRRYFHPLSRIPGPPFWAVSGLPLLYYQGIKEGRVPHMMRELHAAYGITRSNTQDLVASGLHPVAHMLTGLPDQGPSYESAQTRFI